MKNKTDGALFVPEHSALFSNKIKISNKLFWFPEVVALEMCDVPIIICQRHQYGEYQITAFLKPLKAFSTIVTSLSQMEN